MNNIKKYPKQKLAMQTAHKLKNSTNTFSECLKKAWKQVREVYKKAESKAKYGSSSFDMCLEKAINSVNKRTDIDLDGWSMGDL